MRNFFKFSGLKATWRAQKIIPHDRPPLRELLFVTSEGWRWKVGGSDRNNSFKRGDHREIFLILRGTAKNQTKYHKN